MDAFIHFFCEHILQLGDLIILLQRVLAKAVAQIGVHIHCTGFLFDTFLIVRLFLSSRSSYQLSSRALLRDYDLAELTVVQ